MIGRAGRSSIPWGGLGPGADLLGGCGGGASWKAAIRSWLHSLEFADPGASRHWACEPSWPLVSAASPPAHVACGCSVIRGGDGEHTPDLLPSPTRVERSRRSGYGFAPLRPNAQGVHSTLPGGGLGASAFRRLGPRQRARPQIGASQSAWAALQARPGNRDTWSLTPMT